MNRKILKEARCSMRILYLKAGRINEKTGGGIESYKILASLKNWILTNPETELKIISDDYMNIENVQAPKKEKWKDVLSRILFHSSYIFIEYKFKNLKDIILSTEPDVIILGNSRLGFISKEIKRIRPKTYIITHYDNVEYDYVDSYFLGMKGIKNFVKKSIEKIAVKRDEKNSVYSSDLNLLLTKRDRIRLEKIYKKENLQSSIIPICLKEITQDFNLRNNEGVNLFFIGSLWYKSNVVSIEWFLDYVWRGIKEKYPNSTLTIGGNKPSEKLSLKLNADSSIRFFPNFDKAENILFNNSISISPIQKGAGMKTKIAEALSMGFPVIASEESLVGYEEVLEDPLSRCVIFKAESQVDYLESLDRIMKGNFDLLSDKCKYLFRRYYSMERAYMQVEVILEKIKYNKE